MFSGVTAQDHSSAACAQPADLVALELPFATGKAAAEGEHDYSKSILGDSGLAEQNEICKSVSMEDTLVFE